MKRQSLYFTAPKCVEVREEALTEPGSGEVLIETLLSAISPGTEMLIYRGEFPRDLAIDETIAALAGGLQYPMKYGYSSIGRVVARGKDVTEDWHDRLVFAFQPHETHFTAAVETLIAVPDGVSPEDAVFLPNMETAVNFLMDGQPLIGEQVAVLGQGIVGLLTTSLLARLPLASLITVDAHALRRDASKAVGAHAALAVDEVDLADRIRRHVQGQHHYSGADLTYELSGSPQALDLAIGVTGFNGRVVIGSWYGEKRSNLALGGAFHRSRIKLISSQVSTLTPELSGRWTKARRLDTAWEMIRQTAPSRFITQRIGFESASDAYALIDQHPEQTIQVVMTY